MPGQTPGGSDDVTRPYEKPTITALSLPGARAEDPVPEGVCKDGYWVGDPEWGCCGYGTSPSYDTSCTTGNGPIHQHLCGTGMEQPA